MSIFGWMRKYGFVIFMLPFVLFWVDDWATAWHHGGRDSMRHIVWENFYEDVGLFSLWFLWRNLRERYFTKGLEVIHAECPKCHFRWVMKPKQKVPNCPRCGLPEPS